MVCPLTGCFGEAVVHSSRFRYMKRIVNMAWNVPVQGQYSRPSDRIGPHLTDQKLALIKPSLPRFQGRGIRAVLALTISSPSTRSSASHGQDATGGKFAFPYGVPRSARIFSLRCARDPCAHVRCPSQSCSDWQGVPVNQERYFCGAIPDTDPARHPLLVEN